MCDLTSCMSLVFHLNFYVLLGPVIIVCFVFQPLFVALSNVWGGFQDNVVMLSVLSNLITGLRPFVKVHLYVYGHSNNRGMPTASNWSRRE